MNGFGSNSGPLAQFSPNSCNRHVVNRRTDAQHICQELDTLNQLGSVVRKLGILNQSQTATKLLTAEPKPETIVSV